MPCLELSNYAISARRCCTSVISVSPAITDLGECNVGEYRAAVFTVTNDSDLPALVFPYVESETLSITEKEVHIPPRQSKQVRFEYVARLVNTDYKRDAVLMNGYNSHGNVSVEVRAKNVDTQQVLLHSMFYKLHTRNTKRQLQVYFDTCLFNVPNVRTFSLRNVYTETLIIEILAMDDSDEVQIFQIVDDVGSQLLNRGGSQYKSQAMEDLKWGVSPSLSDGPPAHLPVPAHQMSSSSLLAQLSEFDARRKYSLGEAPDPDSLPPVAPIRTIASSVSSSSLDYGTYKSSFSNHSLVLTMAGALGSDRESSGGGHALSPGTDEGKNATRNSVSRASYKKDELDSGNFLSLMDSSNFPFSVFGELERSTDGNSASDSIGRSKGQGSAMNGSGNVPDEESSGTMAVRLIQRCYREFSDELRRNGEGKIHPLSMSTPPGIATVPRGKTVFFAVVFTPKSTYKPEELNQVTLSKELSLRLLVPEDEVESKTGIESTSTIVGPGSNPSLRNYGRLKPMDVKGEPLKPRSIVVRAKACRSEMSITQKNINFGRTTVGEVTTMGVTIMNKSTVPLLYSISKSGSISSGFIRIPSGLRGRISAMKSQTIEFAFCPKLPGPFEETLQIENILDPGNTMSVVIKAKVSKSEYFFLLPAQATSSEPRLLVDSAESSPPSTDLKSKVMALVSSLNPSIISAGGLAFQYLGEMAVGESSLVQLSFRVRNATSKTRNFIVDASHATATSLISTSISGSSTDAEIPFEPIPETLQSICAVRCQFQEYTAEAMAQANRMSLEDRKILEDKLEQFEQKLKIAIRKKKPAKMLKYEKKVAEAREMLSGVLIAKKGDESDDLVGKSTQHLTDSPRRKLHCDAPVYHFQLAAESESLIQVKVTFLPGSSYAHWDGPLPFRGSLRVFEARNEDAVRLVHYCAVVYSSKKSYDASSLAIDPSVDGILDVESVDENHSPYNFNVDRSRRYSAPMELPGTFPRLHDKTLSYSSDMEMVVGGSRASKGSEDMDVDLDESVDVETCVFLTTISQWCSFPTKEIMPRYKLSNYNILGMGLKLVQASRERAMHASFSVASLASDVGSLDVWLEENIVLNSSFEVSSEHMLFHTTEHGPVTFAQGSRLEALDLLQFSSRLRTTLPADATTECIVQWLPPPGMLPEQLLLGYVGVCLTLDNNTSSTQLIPVIWHWDHHSIIKVERSITFGEVPLGSNRDETLALTNVSETEDLVYSAKVLTVSHNNRGVVMLSTTSGEIEPKGKRSIVVNFSGTSLGKFEQELLVENVRDIFDQKRILITAYVTWPQTQFINLPDFKYDEKGKLSK